MNSQFSFPLRVYVEDTDAGGIVYYVNYLKYMERARTEYMRSRGIALAGSMPDELMFVVHSLSMEYHAPARLDDELEASAELRTLRGASLVFDQRVTRGGHTLVSACVRVACVSRQTLAPRAIPGVIRERLDQES